MSARFQVDLLHPGLPSQGRLDWFVGSMGLRHLAVVTLGAAAVLLLVAAGLILPPYWALSADRSAVPALRSDLAAREADLSLLRANLQGLTQEARRQLRWADLLAALSQQTPPGLKVQHLEGVRGAALPASGQPPAGQAPKDLKIEATLRIDAITPQRPGGAPLLEVAQFMASLMRDPAVNKRFQLKGWEIKPGAAGEASEFLNVSIVFGERPQ